MAKENENVDEETEELEEGVIELALDEEQINELIKKLQELKETKGHIHMDIDDLNELLIHHEEDELLNSEEEDN